MDTPNEGIARARGRRVIVPTVGAISYAATSKSLARRKRVEKGDGDSAGVGKEKKEKKTLPKPVHKRKPKTSEKGAGSDKEETKKKKKSKTSPKNKPAKETDELESEEEKEREIEEEEDEREFEEEEEEEEDDESKEEKKGRKKKVSKGEGGGGSGGGEGKEAKKLPKKKGKPIPEDVVKPGAETITITFGDQAENHVGMQTIGTKAAAGFTTDELAALGWEMHDLTPMWVHASDNQGLEAPAASIAILRGGVDVLMGAGAIARLTTEIKSKSVDKKALMRKKVVNKHARWNSIFGDKSQVPSYAEGKGTVHPFTELPELSALRHRLPQVLGSKAKGLVGELNQYYDNTKCGIG
jgi:flagellar biosynthesis GTPase FlhF